MIGLIMGEEEGLFSRRAHQCTHDWKHAHTCTSFVLRFFDKVKSEIVPHNQWMHQMAASNGSREIAARWCGRTLPSSHVGQGLLQIRTKREAVREEWHGLTHTRMAKGHSAAWLVS
jgi:hypothetical protein